MEKRAREISALIKQDSVLHYNRDLVEVRKKLNDLQKQHRGLTLCRLENVMLRQAQHDSIVAMRLSNDQTQCASSQFEPRPLSTFTGTLRVNACSIILVIRSENSSAYDLSTSNTSSS